MYGTVIEKYISVNILANDDMSSQYRDMESDKRMGSRADAFSAAGHSHQRELMQQQEINRLNKALDMFTYSASHDLRSPLTTMMGLINLAEVTKDDADRTQYFAMMRKSIAKLDSLIKEIVDMTMNSKLGLSAGVIDLEKLIEEKADDLSQLKNADKVKIHTDISTEQGITFVSDAGRLKIILSNLLSNAIKFANLRKTPPMVAITASISYDKVLMQVSDNGIGIHEEHLPLIFDMFYRAHDYEVGPGLGLYIAKETIEALGGTINIQSEPMKGTVFTIVLPNLVQQTS